VLRRQSWPYGCIDMQVPFSAYGRILVSRFWLRVLDREPIEWSFLRRDAMRCDAEVLVVKRENSGALGSRRRESRCDLTRLGVGSNSSITRKAAVYSRSGLSARMVNVRPRNEQAGLYRDPRVRCTTQVTSVSAIFQSGLS
jgi:hypothetical protein